MSGIDHLLQLLRKQQAEGARPGSSSAAAAAQQHRFLVTKLSWRGSYRRLLCITPTHILTLYPDTLAVTNSWAYAGDHDLAGVEVGGEHGAEGGVFTLHFRRDKKGLKTKDARFACRERAALLSTLYRGVELAVARGSCGLGPTVLGPAEELRAHKLRRGHWQAVLLRVTAHAVERVDPATGLVKWRLEYRHMASPAARLLAPGEGQPPGQAAFALFGKTGRSPRVHCCASREALLKAMQAAALRKLGLTLAVDSNAQLTGAKLLATVAAAERERAASASDAPLGEWEVMRVKDMDAADLAAARATSDAGGWNGVAHRRLVLTHAGLLERRPGDYEVAEWRQLPAIAALVRFGEDPQWLAVEWADGTPAATYVTPARDALLAALLDAAQAAAGRPIPVLCQPTSPGDVIVSQRAQAVAAPAVLPDGELEKLCLHQLNAAARDFVAAGGQQTSLAALALAGLSAASASSGLASPATASISEDAGAAGTGGQADGEGSDAAPSGTASPRSAASSAGASGNPGGTGPLGGAAAAASGRSGFMQRAFARQGAAGGVAGNGGEGAGGGVGPGRGGAASTTGAFALFQQRVREFNACVPYAGPQGCRVDDVVITALLSHLPRQQGSAGNGLGDDEARLTVAALQCLQRLAGAAVAASTRHGSGTVAVSQIIGASGGAGRIFAALLSGHDHVAAEAARLLLRFFAPSAARAGASPWAGPGGEPTELSEEERAAVHASKSVCFISQSRCAALVGVLRQARGAPLLSMAVAEAAAAVVCDPSSRSTDRETLEAVLQESAALGRPLFALFSHPAPRVGHAAALIMRAVAEGGAEAAQPMREAALTEGAFLTHLLSALSPARAGGHAALSRELVALWADEYSPALGLLRRVFPPGLVRYLNQRRPGVAPRAASRAASAAAPAAAGAGQAAAAQSAPGPQQGEAQAAQATAAAHVQQQPAAARTPGQAVAPAASADPLQSDALTQQPQQQQRQQQHQVEPERAPSPVQPRLLSPPPDGSGGLKGNWEAFWAAAQRDHCHAALVWNEATRGELREALQAEEASLRLARMRSADSSAPLAWNHAEFRVAYPSLSKHLCIGGVYVRLLLEAHSNAASSASAAGGAGANTGIVERLPAPREFFMAAHHRLLCLGDTSLLMHGLSASHVTSQGGAGGGPPAAGSSGSSAGVPRESEAEADRELCLRAMAAVYHVHAGTIGPVDGIPHLLALLDATASRALRQHLLLLLEALVAPSVLASSAAADAHDADATGSVHSSTDAAARAARANGVAVLEARGVPLLVDVLAAAHEGSDLPAAALQQTQLIAASSHAEQQHSLEWFYFPGGGAAVQGAPAGSEDGRVGPVSKAEIRQLYSSGDITAATPFWAAGMPEPLPLAAVRELRWWVARKQGPLTALQAAGAALRVLQALADQQPAVDAAGEVLHPLPLAHRLMASSGCLPHIAQLLLTGEPALVSVAATLLLTVLQHNSDGLAALYRTGIHFFALAYCGSNLREVARLLKACHLRASSADAAGRPLAERSILGGLLPDSLLHMLESYGPDQFAAALVGDSDTPELIWTHRMRGQRLVPQMLRHLGDFPRRLREHCHAVYEYTPCPPVGYPEVEGEVFCHRYYLRHLCDETRHSGWPLADHVQLLQSLLDAWRAELARQPLSMSETEACGVLGITPGPDGGVLEEELKAAYRRLARLYHPDKNPAGRDRFMGVQAAYERLQAGAEGGQGPQPWRILLLLRAQCVLFRRCPEELAPFKYAGYPLLLQAIVLPGEEGQSSGAAAQQAHPAQQAQQQHFLSAEAAPQLQAATELCWLTCAASRLNGDELTRAGGLGLLGRLLSRCIAVVPADVAPHEPAVVIATHALRALAVMAAFENARVELAGSQQLVADIVRCCALQRAPAAVEAALLCLARCCASPALQALLLQRGMLGHVLPLLLAFDGSQLREDQQAQQQGLAAPSPAPDDATAVLRLPLVRANAQTAKNLHAQLAVRALAALAGYPAPHAEPTASSDGQGGAVGGVRADQAAPQQRGAAAAPACPPAQRALAALLTETLAPRLAEPDPVALLTDLNSTLQTPQVIWNNSMRAELLEVLERQRAAAVAAGEPEAAAAAAAEASGFSYKSLRGELVLSGVFVRLYTEQPGFVLADPAAFCKALVTWIYGAQQEAAAEAGTAGTSAGELAATAGAAADGDTEGEGGEGGAGARQRQRHLVQALRALRLVLDASPRLLGLLGTRPAVDPLLECLRPACIAGLPGGPAWAASASAGSGYEAAAATLAAAPPGWAAADAPAGSGAELDEAELALEVLLRLTAHAGCLEALSQDKCIAQAFWLAHRAPNTALLMLALRLLHALAATAACAWGAAAHGGTLYLLTLLLPAYQVPEEQREAQDAARVAAAALLSRLAAHQLHGTRVALILSKLLPPGLVAAIRDGPGEAAVAALGQASNTPERVWNRSMQRAAAEEIAHLAAVARSQQASTGQMEWQLPNGYELRYHELADELAVGGVYVRLFLKDPRYPLRDPKAFLEGLLERYVREVQGSTRAANLGSPSKPGLALVAPPAGAGVATAAAGSAEPDGSVGGGSDVALLLSAAAVALLQAQPALSDHAVSLGYLEKLVRLLAARAPALPPQGLSPELLDAAPLLPDELSGSLLRLLHQLAACSSAAEALARCSPPAAPPLLGAMRWGTAASVLALEALKRALTPSNRWRNSLVEACLSAGLVPLLLHRLDWRRAKGQEQGGQEERDASVQRVLYVDLLNLLALDAGAAGGPGERVRAALDASDVWAAYRGQRHDLFLPAGGSHASGVAGLLQGPEASRFALPPALLPPPTAQAPPTQQPVAGPVVDAPPAAAPPAPAAPQHAGPGSGTEQQAGAARPAAAAPAPHQVSHLAEPAAPAAAVAAPPQQATQAVSKAPLERTSLAAQEREAVAAAEGSGAPQEQAVAHPQVRQQQQQQQQQQQHVGADPLAAAPALRGVALQAGPQPPQEQQGAGAAPTQSGSHPVASLTVAPATAPSAAAPPPAPAVPGGTHSAATSAPALGAAPSAVPPAAPDRAHAAVAGHAAVAPPPHAAAGPSAGSLDPLSALLAAGAGSGPATSRLATGTQVGSLPRGAPPAEPPASGSALLVGSTKRSSPGQGTRSSGADPLSPGLSVAGSADPLSPGRGNGSRSTGAAGTPPAGSGADAGKGPESGSGGKDWGPLGPLG